MGRCGGGEEGGGVLQWDIRQVGEVEDGSTLGVDRGIIKNGGWAVLMKWAWMGV